jgi:hypothetical protein
MIERRHEPRAEVDLVLAVWGIDSKGDRFLQHARARDVSLSGALLSELDAELRSGDLVGVLYASKKARFRVVWVRYSGTSRKIQAAIHRLEGDECPWEHRSIGCRRTRRFVRMAPARTRFEPGDCC